MITIEGLGGNGALWCTFRLPMWDVSSLPSEVTAFCQPKKFRINTITPFECLLPPVTAEGISFPVEFSSFGPKCTQVEVGSLMTINNSPGTPHPCEHSTVNGTLLYCGTEEARAIPYCNVVVPPTTDYRNLFREDKTPIVAYQGRPTGKPYMAYNRLGVKVPLTVNSANADLWFTNTAHLSGWRYPVGSSIPSSGRDAVVGEWLYASLYATPPLRWDTGPCMPFRFQASRSSRYTFEESVEVEYHHDASYGKPDSLGPFTGLGYMRAYVGLHRTHRIISIQSLQASYFRVLVETTQDEGVWGHRSPLQPLVTGVSPVSKSLQWICLQVLEPGLSVAAPDVPTFFSQYCENAKVRAKELFRHGSATIARSRAVSDVSGLDSNWIENLSQVRGAPSVFDFLLEGQAAVKSGNIVAARRALSSAYLAYSYVLAPGIRDANDLNSHGGDVLRSFTKFRYSNERRRGMYSISTPVLDTTADTSYFCTLHLCLKDNSFSAVWNALERLGLDPSANNLWDCIPFSFVVDWFLKIGPALDKISAYNNNVLVRDVKSRIETFKAQWPLTEEDLVNEHLTDYSVGSPLVYSWYDRRVHSGMGSIDPLAGQSLDGPSLSQMVQGGALLSVYR